MPGDRRAGAAEHAEHVNAAAGLLEAGVPAAEAARVLAGRLGCSQRQARRYVARAAESGRVRGPGRGRGVHRPASGPAGRRGAGARPRVRPHDLVGRRAGAGGVPRPRSRGPSGAGEGAARWRRSTSSPAMPPPKCQWPTGYWCRSGGPGPPPRRRKEESGDGSGDLRAGLQRPAGEGPDDRLPARPRCASTPRPSRLDVPEEWVFADEGHSGATLVRPGLEALRDLAAQGCLDVVLVYSPDRLARKFAYQALLIEELARCGVRVEFVKGPRGDSPEDQLLVQFQGMFAEYEKAQLMERYRRGKAWRAKTGSVNVLSGAPFGYRYVRKTPESGARYEVVAHEAALVAEMFRRYADDGAAIADLRRWLTDQGVRHPHRQGTLGPVGDLGHAPQPRLRRHRGLRQDPGRPRAGRAEPHRPPRRPHRPAAGQGRGPAAGGMDRDPGPRPGGRGDVRPGPAAAGRQQAVRLAEHEGPVPAAGPGRLRVLRLRLLPHHHDHDRREQDLLLPVPRLRRLPLPGRTRLRATSPSAPTTPTRSSGTTSPPCSPTPPSSAPRSARGWKGPARRTRSPASAASSSRPSRRPPRRSPR